MEFPLSIDEIVKQPYSVYVIGEMGVGKTTFLELLESYQDWLLDEETIEDKIFHVFREELPPWWEGYIKCKDENIRDEVIYKTQRWFARRKIENMYKAAGWNSEGNVPDVDQRTPGFYFVDRSLHEDRYVFAQNLMNLFPEGKFKQYEKEVDQYLESAPDPDLVIRLRVETPEVSQQRVMERGTGERLPLSRYHKMSEDYEQHIDPWIEDLGIPVINIRSDLEHLDFDTTLGQQFFITSLTYGLHSNGIWNYDKLLIPLHTPINGD